MFHRWHVVGYNERRFTGYKFTSMVADAGSRKTELMSRNEMQGPVFKIRDDPRINVAQRYLRKFSLNELPQLWSVLKGDMSLVGLGRPSRRAGALRDLAEAEAVRAPGDCVCLANQGRNKISRFDDWVKMDFEYIDNWSLWLDVKILIRTVWTIVAGTGS